MARKKIDFDIVRKIARELPDIEDCTTYGSPALKVHGKLLTCLPTHKSAEPDSLAVRIDVDQRAALLAEAPDIYYVKDHYVPYPMVLVRMARIDREALRDLLAASWKFVTSERRGRARLRKFRPV
ncbi:MAG TPA: MmcQ/YjbR family DNA-binding protein [Bryobacteraceae bacterium]